MSTALIFLAEGFEETEAVGTIDILRRGGVDVTIVSISDCYNVVGAHNIEIVADQLISEVDLDGSDALILPGGMPGTTNLMNSDALSKALLAQYKKCRIVAAICAAPMIFGKLSIASGKKVTCYPGCEANLKDSEYTSSKVEKDGNVITGRAPGTVYEFALKILEELEGKQIAASVADGLTTANSLGY